MKRSKIRRQIAWEAARLMFHREESEYYPAKMKAGRRICRGWIKPVDLPSNGEIRDQVQLFARILEGQRRTDSLFEMRLEALCMMRILKRFRPRLIGSVLSGHIRHGSDIDLHLFSNSLQPVAGELQRQGKDIDVRRKRITKNGEFHVYRHILIRDRFPFELTIYPENKSHFVFKSSITGKPMERASIAQFEQFLAGEYPDVPIDEEVERVESEIDRFQYYYSLLLPLDKVQQDVQYHPEGDALYHSLQVFDLAADRLPYDEEFLTAALLHDVGKAIDRHDHVVAGLEALDGFITPRTAWLIAHHMDAHQFRQGKLGHRARRRLSENDSFDELMLLQQCNVEGRKSGVETTELEQAVDDLRDISSTFSL